MKVSFILVICLLGMAVITRLSAQNETGSRYLNEERFKAIGYWYDSTTAGYQVRYPIIRNIPPVGPSMPLEMLFSYIVTDSLCRFAPQKDVTNLVKSWNHMNDTLRYAAKYLYKMIDYNPIIFTQYQDQVTLLRNSPFKTNLFMLRQSIRDKHSRLITPKSEKNAVFSLLGADYILRIQVVKVDSMPDKISSGQIRYRVTAKVLDTLKGRIYQPAPCGNNGHSVLDATSPYPCMYFQYGTYNYFDAGNAAGSGTFTNEADYEPWPYLEQDSAFMRGRNCFAMQAGQEAIIFLAHTTQRFDHENDYYDLELAPIYSYNALPIINGQVRDVNKVWSDNLLMSYPDWKARYEQLRDKILNGSY